MPASRHHKVLLMKGLRRYRVRASRAIRTPRCEFARMHSRCCGRKKRWIGAPAT